MSAISTSRAGPIGGRPLPAQRGQSGARVLEQHDALQVGRSSMLRVSAEGGAGD